MEQFTSNLVGRRTGIASIAAAHFVLILIIFAAPLIEQIPLAALIGVVVLAPAFIALRGCSFLIGDGPI
jgi:MFS superfamily sulfate permease-like transporter